MNDILLGDNWDLDLSSGDIKTGQSDEQNVKLILTYSPGHLKQYLLIGVGIIRSKNGVITRFMKSNIRKQLINDGFRVKKIDINSQGILIDGKY